jgi:hypothetical protein
MAMKDNTSELPHAEVAWSSSSSTATACIGVSVLSGSRLDQLRAKRLP